MALQKEVVTHYGVTANYFRISGIDINSILKTAKIKLNGYYNEEARLDDSRSLQVKEYNIKDEDFTTYFNTTLLSSEGNNIYTSGYRYIKDTDESFIDAIDV
jgi:hypothetical protein